MAKPIKETPTLYGEDARRFLEEIGDAPVRPESAGWKPSSDDLFKFWESSLNLFVEGVEFMTKEQIYHAIKADCMEVSND